MADQAAAARAELARRELARRGVTVTAPVAVPAPSAFDGSGFGRLANAAGGVGESALQVATGLASSVGGGVAGIGQGIKNLFSPGMPAGDRVRQVQEGFTYQPRGEAGQQISNALASGYNPLNWPGMVGENLGGVAADAGAPALLSTGIQLAPDALAAAFGVRGAKGAKAPARAPAPEAVPPAAPAAPAVPVAPLSATGAARARPYTDLEGAIKENKPPKFVEETPVAHQGAELPPDQQAARREILGRVGLEGDVRMSAVTGDAKAASTDFQLSKLDTADGQLLSRALSTEREALGNYADRLVQETGGTRGLGQTETLQRGQSIVAPLDSLKQHFDTRISSLYRIADERAEGRPFDTKKVREIVGDDSEFLGTVEGESLLRGVKARMKSLKMVDPDGVPMRTTVQQAERLKQYLGDQWTPRTSRLIRRIKEAVDEDVMLAAGEDVYASARALRAERARILDDPNGIAKIMDSEGPEGINRSVALEKIADTMATLPVRQFEQIVRTLNEAPAEIRPQAHAALAEIKSHFANKVMEIGNKTQTQWNAKQVSKYLNDNSARMKAVFSPDELKKFADLNDAGHILRFESSYPGASVQATNLLRAKAAEGGLTAVGTGIGAIFGPAGAAGGAFLGQRVGSRLSRGINEREALKSAQKRLIRIDRRSGISTGELDDAGVARVLEGRR